MKESLIDASAVKHMTETAGWHELERELELMIADLKDMLVESAQDDERIRGRIEALRTVLQWPAVVEAEAQSRALEQVE